MGYSQNTLNNSDKATAKRLPLRLCYRKDCGNRFLPRRWNQRYCQQPHCTREVRCWLAAKRQRRRRASPEHRKQHAEAEQQRRIRKKQQANSTITDNNSNSDAPLQQQRAWSRSKTSGQDFCDRPGCYEPRRTSSRTPAKYCGHSCRQAVRRVTDRERKWLRRNTSAGRFKRKLEYQRRVRNVSARPPEDADNTTPKSGGGGGGEMGGRQLFAVF